MEGRVVVVVTEVDVVVVVPECVDRVKDVEVNVPLETSFTVFVMEVTVFVLVVVEEIVVE